MSGFSASAVAFNVQKNFANKFFSNKSIVKGLIDDTSAKLLDDLYNLLFAFVSPIFTSLTFKNNIPNIADK